jgi:hypothetical protein
MVYRDWSGERRGNSPWAYHDRDRYLRTAGYVWCVDPNQEILDDMAFLSLMCGAGFSISFAGIFTWNGETT